MKKLLFSLFVLGLVGIAPNLPPRVGQAQKVMADAETTMTLDVACDGRTFSVNGVDPAATDFARGDTFIVDGKVYPGGTIPAGGTPEKPVFSPDQPGSIGDWTCRGFFNFSSAQMAAGSVPHVTTTQLYLLKDGRGLVSEGKEGGIPTVRAVIGGMGDFSGAVGQVREEEIGVNSTGLFNIRFTFTLK